MPSERSLLAWLEERLPHVGDDVAHLPPGEWVVTTDHQVPGVHLPQDAPPGVIADRLLRVNLSDLAAGGARPRFAFANLAAPTEYPFRDFLQALLTACDEFELTLGGGDISNAPQPVFSLTVLGELPEGSTAPSRNRARAGDRLWLSGIVGSSLVGRLLIERAGTVAEAVAQPASGLDANLDQAARHAVRRHLKPVPQLNVGSWLAVQRRAASIDLSDGLALDLHRLAEQSGVGAVLDAEQLPVDRHHAELCAALGVDPLQAALAGGEDYVLLFALPPNVEPPSTTCAVEVGRTTAEGDIRLWRGGELEELPATGWDHLNPEWHRSPC